LAMPNKTVLAFSGEDGVIGQLWCWTGVYLAIPLPAYPAVALNQTHFRCRNSICVHHPCLPLLLLRCTDVSSARSMVSYLPPEASQSGDSPAGSRLGQAAVSWLIAIASRAQSEWRRSRAFNTPPPSFFPKPAPQISFCLRESPPFSR